MRWPLGIVLLALALAPALAQTPAQQDSCRPPVLEVERAPAAFEPGSSTTLSFAIDNPNGAPVDAVRATVTTTAPAGWTVTAAQRELTLGPHNFSVDVLAVTAPSRGTGASAGNITILVAFVCTVEDIQTSSSASTTIEVRIQQFSAPWTLVLGIFLAMLAGVVVLGVRRLRRGVALYPLTPERAIEAGKSTKFTLALENRRGKPQKLRFYAVGVPDGWTIHLALEDVDLEPGEEKTLWAILRAPPSALPGAAADVTLLLESPDEPREAAEARVRAVVAAPGGEAEAQA